MIIFCEKTDDKHSKEEKNKVKKGEAMPDEHFRNWLIKYIETIDLSNFSEEDKGKFRLLMYALLKIKS